MFLAVGIIGILVGLACILISREKWANLFRQANQAKGREVYSEQSIATRVKFVKITGPIGLLFGVLLVFTELTGI